MKDRYSTNSLARRSRIAPGLICLLGGLMVLAANQSVFAAVQLQVGNATGAPGGAVLIPVALSSDEPVLAAQFDFAYPVGNLVSDGAVLGDGAGGLTLLSREITPGLRRVILYSASSKPLPAGPLVNIPINIAADAKAGTANLSLTNAILSDAQFLRVPQVSPSNGTLTIGSESASVRFTSVSFDPAGMLHLELSGRVGRSYTIEASTNLIVWKSLTSGAALNGVLQVTDTNLLGSPYKFYRALPATGF